MEVVGVKGWTMIPRMHRNNHRFNSNYGVKNGGERWREEEISE
jgi:hypothetical protein